MVLFRGEHAEAKKYREEGEVFYKAREFTKALEAFNHSLRLNPAQAVVHSNLGIAYGSSGQKSEAAEAFAQALRLREKSGDENFTEDEARFNLVLALLNLDMKREATEQCRILESRDPELANELSRLIEK